MKRIVSLIIAAGFLLAATSFAQEPGSNCPRQGECKCERCNKPGVQAGIQRRGPSRFAMRNAGGCGNGACQRLRGQAKPAPAPNN